MDGFGDSLTYRLMDFLTFGLFDGFFLKAVISAVLLAKAGTKISSY